MKIGTKESILKYLAFITCYEMKTSITKYTQSKKK